MSEIMVGENIIFHEIAFILHLHILKFNLFIITISKGPLGDSQPTWQVYCPHSVFGIFLGEFSRVSGHCLRN